MRGADAAELELLFPGESEMAKRMRSFDWSRSSAGPVETWPETLRTSVRIILNSRYPMFLWWGRDALTYFYNDAYIPVLGSKHPAALGRSGKHTWPEIWEDLRPFVDGVFVEGRPSWSEELPLTMERSGFREETFFTFSYSPILEGDGSVGGLFCACTEETRRVVAERRLRTQRALAGEVAAARDIDEACTKATRHLLSNAHDLPFVLLYLLDDRGEIARLAAVMGLGDREHLCESEVDLSDASHLWRFPTVARTRASELIPNIGRSFADGVVPSGTWPEPPRHALVTPLLRPGHPVLAGFVVFGLSPRRPLDDDYRGFCELLAGHLATGIINARAYHAERERSEALAALDRAKTTFFSNVSHELRTPLTLMLGPIEDALRGADESLGPRTAERLDLAHRNSLRLLKLVNALLDFSRIEAGRVQASYEPVDLGACTAELATAFRATMERGGLDYVIDCGSTSTAWVDREMWEKVVLNLLSNAFKFTLSGSVTVRMREEDDGFVLTVRDTGSGIPGDELPHVFDRFHRVEGARGRTFEGTGIGLALVQELVRLHGGATSVTSEPGQGTEFTVRVPKGSGHLPPERLGPGRMSISASLGAAPYVDEALQWLGDVSSEHDACAATIETEGARILVADDNQDMRGYIQRLLAPYWSVETVADGAAALARTRERLPDLVLADVMMPRLDGFELLQALRADERTRTLPVILLSARAGEDARVEGLEAAADDYLTKPFSARELVARVAAHLKLASLRRETQERLREQDRRKDEFLAMLAHELRNPLAPIGSAANVLSMIGPPEPRLVRARSIILRQVAHMARLVDDLLDVSRITRGKIELHKERMPLGEAIEVALESVRPLFDARQQTVTVLGGEGIELVADRARVVQVVTNLLSNAAKFSPKQGHIEIRTEARPEGVSVCVRDDGVGLSKQARGRIFDLFVQEDASAERSRGGLGIGLTLVKRLVELHGGSVTVASDGPGSGAEFTVSFPAAVAGGDTVARGVPVPSRGQLRVLVIEDNVDAAESLQMLLELDGHDVSVAGDGPAGLRAVGDFQPDVALVDLGLPGMDGLTLARTLCENLPKRPMLVALSGYGRPEDKEKAKKAGFDHHLTKPAEIDAIRALLASVRGIGNGDGRGALA